MHIEYGDEKKNLVSDGSFSILIKGDDQWGDINIFDFTLFSKKVEIADSFTVYGKTVEILNCDWDFVENVIPNYSGDLLCEIDYNDIHFTITK